MKAILTIITTLFLSSIAFTQSIDVAPDSITVTIESGDSLEVPITISNTGTADLEWAFYLEQFSIEFTNCGQEGRIGPTQAMCNDAYAGTDLEGLVMVPDDAGIQGWTVPHSGIFTIEVWGAEGGIAPGGSVGLGARIAGNYLLTSGEIIKILVGQAGQAPNDDEEAGGGGGTFVVSSTDDPLFIAGGGGGCLGSPYNASRHANSGTNGNSGYNQGASGGTNGNGGNANNGGGGGGFYFNGDYGDPNENFGRSFFNGGIGGFGGNNANGGFGGGAGGGNDGAGGGGGYSGGGGNGTDLNITGNAGGGGSYNAGTNQENISGVNEGHGRVVITYVGLSDYISATQDTSIIFANESQETIIQFNTSELSAGNYQNDIEIFSNDTLNSPYSIPVNLMVTGSPELTLPATDIVFDSLYIGFSDTQDFIIQNTGSDTLNINLNSNHNDFTLSDSLIQIPAWSEVFISTTFTPTTAYDNSAEITIESNAGTEIINLSGYAMNPPILTMNPDSVFNLDLLVGQSMDTSFQICNDGLDEDLNYSLAVSSPVNYAYSEDFDNGLGDWVGGTLDTNACGSQSLYQVETTTLTYLEREQFVFDGNNFNISFNYHRDNTWGSPLFGYVIVNEEIPLELPNPENADFELPGDINSCTDYNFNLSSYVNTGDYVRIGFYVLFAGFYIDEFSMTGAGKQFLNANSSGNIQPETCDEVPLNINIPNDYVGGDYTVNLNINHSDPILQNPYTYPVQLHLTGVAIPQVYADSINFGWTYTNFEASPQFGFDLNIINNEDFDDNNYNDFWSWYGYGWGWNTNAQYYNSADRSIYLYGNNSDSYLYSNSFIVHGGLELSFWYYLEQAETDCYFRVQLNVNNTGYINVWSSQAGDYNNSTINFEDEVYLDLNDFVQDGDNVQIQFIADVYSGDSQYDDVGVYLDDIIIYSGKGIRISNLGTDVLDVSFAFDNEVFSISAETLSIPAFSDGFANLSFLPNTAGNIDGNLTITTNTDDEFTIQLNGYAANPPVMTTENTNLFFSLDSGTTACHNIIINNTSDSDTTLSDLYFNISANDYIEQMQFTPQIDTIFAGENNAVEVCFNANNINSGDYFGSFVVNGNDPYNAIDTIQTQIHVNGLAEIYLAEVLEFGDPFYEEYMNSYNSWTSFWTESGSGDVTYDSSYDYSSPYCIRMYGFDNNYYLTSDSLSLDGHFKMEFYYRINDSEQNCNFQVQLSRDNGSNYETIWESAYNTTNGWLPIEIEMFGDDLGSDNIKVQFVANVGSPASNENYINIYIDDIKLYNGELNEISDMMDFDSNYTFESNDRILMVHNPGTDTLRITDILTGTENLTIDTSLLHIAMGESEFIQMTYTPVNIGLDSTEVSILTNIGESSFNSFITGLGHSQIGFEPVEVIQTVTSGDTAHITVTIHNPGDDTLVFEIGDPTGDVTVEFFDDFENGLDKWNYTGSYPMEISDAGEGYNSEYSLQAGGQYSTTHYQEMKDWQIVIDRDNALIEFYAKSEGNNRWIDYEIDFGQGWYCCWGIIYINNTNWTNYTYDYTWILDQYNIQNGDQIKFKLRMYAWSNSSFYIDDIAFNGIGGRFDDFMIDSSYVAILAPGDSTELSFHIAATTMAGGKEYSGTLPFSTNNPVNPNVELPITIFVDGPDIELIEDDINFEDVVLGADQHQRFFIYNDGSQNLTVDSLILSNAWFELSEIPAIPFQIPAGDSTEITLRYSAYDLNSHNANLTIYNSDVNKPFYGMSINVSGTWNNFEITLDEGWNLLGPVMDFPVSTVIDSFETVIPYSWYGWDNGAYHFADTLYAGTGYWVAALNNENIYVPNLYDVQPSLPRILDDDELLSPLNKINIVSEDHSQILYFGDFESEEIPVESFNLPPILPEIKFDVRFENQSRLFSDNQSNIELISDKYPIEINWNLREKFDNDEKRYLVVDGNKIDMDIQSEFIIERQPNEIILINKVIPNDYVLYQNYPNPFNPETRIKYGLAEESEVSLMVYDVNGRAVRDLVSNNQESGYYEILWDGQSNQGSALPSGIYFIRMLAKNTNGVQIVKTQKSLLLK